MELIEGFLRPMAAPDDVTGPINLGNLVEATVVGQLAEKIIALIGSRPVIERRPLPVGDPVQRCPDISRARDILAWAPRVPLDTGLERTIACFDRLLGDRQTFGAQAGASAACVEGQPAQTSFLKRAPFDSTRGADLSRARALRSSVALSMSGRACAKARSSGRSKAVAVGSESFSLQPRHAESPIKRQTQ